MLNKKYFEQNTYSEEGFKELVDRVKSLFSSSKKPKPPKRKGKDKEDLETYSEQIKYFYTERKSLLNDYKSTINKTYLNSDKINKMKFVEGNVKATDITNAFILDNKYQEDFEKAVSDNFNNLKKLDHYKEAYNELVNTANMLDGELIKLTKDFKNPDDLNSDEAAKSAEEIGLIIKPFLKEMPEYTSILNAEFKKLPKTFLPNLTKAKETGYSVDYVEYTTKTPDTLPALTAETIKDTANLSIKIIDYLLSIDEWKRGGSYEDDGEVLRYYYDWSESLLEKWYDLTYYQNFWHYHLDYVEEGMLDVLYALEKYIDRSVK